MGPYDYEIVDFKGEYAYLKRIDIVHEGDLFMIATALLPYGVDIGTKLRFENLLYTII